MGKKGVLKTLVQHIRRDKKAFAVFVILRTLVVTVLIRSAVIGQ